VEIHYRVQHAAGRDAALSRLLERLPPAVEVITDHEIADPNPLRNYLCCLENPPAKATHLAVLQDDALPCKRFDALLREAVSERPDDVISLFVGGLTSRTRKDFYLAMKRGERWTPVYFREIHHVVGLVWPVALAAHFLEWYPQTRVPGPNPPRSDDAVVGFWARKTKHQVWATVPCLVEHDDLFPSMVQGHSRFGDRGRRAIHWEEQPTENRG